MGSRITDFCTSHHFCKTLWIVLEEIVTTMYTVLCIFSPVKLFREQNYEYFSALKREL